LEEDQKVLIDPSLEGKTREEMGLEPFVAAEIRSSIMGVPVFINQEIIAYVIGRASEGNYKDGLDNNKKSPWNDVVNETMFNSKKKGSYSNCNTPFSQHKINIKNIRVFHHKRSITFNLQNSTI